MTSFLIFITIAFFGVLGAVVGSFLNVVVFRTVSGEQWLTGRSKCDYCEKQLNWFDNIPLLSYLILKGKTRCCNEKLSMSHPIVEVLTGALFMWWYAIGIFFVFKLSSHPYSVLQPIFWLVVGVILIGIAIADLLYFVIPDIFTYSLTILVILYRVLLLGTGNMQFIDFVYSFVVAFGLTGLFLFLWFITHKKGFGLGDVKFALPMGLLLGWPRILVGVFAAFVIGASWGIILLAKKKKWRQIVPFGPFLVLGTILALLWGYPIANWYLKLLL